MWASLAIAERLAPRFRALGPEDEIVQRYREAIGPHAGKLRIAVSAVFALIAGGGVSSQWSSFILFRNSVEFGLKDAQFHRDLGFYVFRLPFLRFVVDWLFVAIVIITFVTRGGALPQRRHPSAPLADRAGHAAGQGARLGAARAAGAGQGGGLLPPALRPGHLAPGLRRRPQLHRRPRAAAGHQPADLRVADRRRCCFLANIRLQGWLLPGIAVGLWLFLSVVVGGIYPALVQRVRVVPAENEKERPYIERNIAATRIAMGIDAVKTVPFEYNEDLNAAGLAQNAETIRNMRLWDPKYTRATFAQDQKLRAYYQLSDLDIDRYMVDGQPHPGAAGRARPRPRGPDHPVRLVGQPTAAVHPRVRRSGGTGQRGDRRQAQLHPARRAARSASPR